MWPSRGSHIIPFDRATVSVPKIGLKDVTVAEGGEIVWRDGAYVSGIQGITGGSESAGYVTLEVGSGDYLFTMTGIAKRSVVPQEN